MQKIQSTKGRKGQKGRDSKYDIAFKRKIAMEYEQGNLSTTQLGKKYNIRHQGISEWVKQFSSELAEGDKVNISAMTEEEQKEVAVLKRQIEELQKRLEYEQMRNFALETMADLAKTELGIDIRKNSGAKQPKG